MAANILIIDDEADICELISEILREENYKVRTAGSSDAALKAIEDKTPDVIILDLWLHGSELDGLGVLEIVKNKYPSVAVITISGHGNIETAVKSMKMGAYDFLEKPFTSERISFLVKRAIETSKPKFEDKELKSYISSKNEILGDSKEAGNLRKSIGKIAETNCRILINGEYGTGKEKLARIVHSKSLRKNNHFVSVKTSGKSDMQIMEEIFGSESPQTSRISAIERANGGTLFIEEVCNLSKNAQQHIINLLNSSKFKRMGAQKDIDANIRLICSSRKNLKNEVSNGNLREDFYSRISVVVLENPALRKRREDIPVLCEYFLQKTAKIFGGKAKKFDADAMAVLQSHEWPGNLRELKNVVEWSVIMQQGEADEISAEMLPQIKSESSSSMSGESFEKILSMPLKQAREVFEKQYLVAQINRFGGNISKTSSFIGMERSALHRKLKLLGVKD